tara:strand:- start:869 stop:1075 length:207 start_codon:yes stop_codon:yes gene_type:complete
MKHLVGRIFTIGDGAFRVVDVQRLGGDALVYAEAQPDSAAVRPEPAMPPARMAFHYGDIADALEQAVS